MEKVERDPSNLRRPDGNSLFENYSIHDVGEAYFKEVVENAGLHAENWGIDMREDEDSLIFDNKLDLRLWKPIDGQGSAPATWPTDVSGRPHGDHGCYRYRRDSAGDTINFGWAVLNDGELTRWEIGGVADVKTKTSASWFGIFNVRHLAHYAEWADRYDHPVFVYMTMVDEAAEEVGEEEFIVEIPTDWNWQLLCDYYDDDSTDLTYGDIKDITRECAIVDRTFRAPDQNLVIDTDESEWQSLDYITKEVL